MRELQTPECMTAVRAGLGSIIPLQLLTTLTPLEMELRTCGLPYINLEFLKVGELQRFWPNLGERPLPSARGAGWTIPVEHGPVLARPPLPLGRSL